MPATDRCEPPIIRAIEKAGWNITHNPFAIKIDRSRGGYVYADARFEQADNGQKIIVVEVKCFDSKRTILELDFIHIRKHNIRCLATITIDSQEYSQS